MALFLGVGAAGVLASSALYSEPVISGAGGSALALLAVWATPDLLALQAHDYHEGDLLGAGAFAVLVLASSFVLDSATGFAAIAGGVLGLVFGLGLLGWAAAIAPGTRGRPGVSGSVRRATRALMMSCSWHSRMRLS